MVGKIQLFHELRGYGFLLKDFRTRIFFHITEWKSDMPPAAGMVVLYDLIPARRAGFQTQAANVRPVETGLNAEQNDAFVLALNDGGVQ